MRIRKFLCLSTLAAFAATLEMGCQGDDVKLAAPTIKEVQIINPHPSKDPKRGGGSGSSLQSTRNPGASN